MEKRKVDSKKRQIGIVSKKRRIQLKAKPPTGVSMSNCCGYCED